MGCSGPGGTECAGQPEAVGADQAPLEASSSLWHSKGLTGWSFSACQVFKGPPAPRLRPFSIAWHISHSKGHPVWSLSAFVGCWPCHAGRERLHAPSVHDSAVAPCLHGCPAFLLKAVPTAASFLLSPWTVSLQSAAVLILGLLLSLCPPAPSPCVFPFQWSGPAASSRLVLCGILCI